MKRPEYQTIGKMAIAAVLIGFENERALFNDPPGHRDWYEYLFNKLNTSFKMFRRNTVPFLTFNYDRSLEHYLLTSLKNSYGKTDDEYFTKMSELPIVHLHGQLGDF